MATLKSIKNKYLTASDGTVLGVTTNTENISALSFKLATADSLTKFNLVDGFTDDYNDATGVDAGASTDASRNASNYYVGTLVPAGNDSDTVFLCNMDGANDGTTFTDTSVGGSTHTITANGNAHTDTTIKKIGTASAQFDGTNSYLNLGDSSDWAFGAGNFTFDFWIYQESFGGYAFNQEVGSYWWRMEQKSGGMEFNFYNNGSYANGWSSSLPWSSGTMQDSWHHIALERDGANIRGWLDGTEVTMTQGNAPGSNNVPNIASDVNLGRKVSGSGYMEGYLDEFRISKVARYDADFTPLLVPYGLIPSYEDMILVSNAFTAQADPTTVRIVLDERDATGTSVLDTDIKAYASRDNGTTFTQMPLADQGFLLSNPFNDGYTKLMLHCDGADSGTTFTDSSDSLHTVTVVGTAHTDTSVKKFGTASLQCDGNSDELTVADSDDWNFGTSPFTLDFWFNISSTNEDQRFLGQYEDTNNRWYFGIHSANRYFQIYSKQGGTIEAYYISADNTYEYDTWTHAAFVRDGTNVYLFVDGLSKTLTTVGGADIGSDAWGDDSAVLRIGQTGGTATEWLNGYMDEIRVSKGIARWTSAFTPPVQPYNDNRRLLSGSVDISGQPAGSNMKYKIETFNQSSSKITRVYGTSMAWA